MKINVTIAEMQSAVTKLSNALSDFGTATAASKSAGETVLAGWAGDARDKFEAQHSQTQAWFNEMSGIVSTYVAAINSYLTSLLEADATASSSISSK